VPHFAIVRGEDCEPLGAFELNDSDYRLGSVAEVEDEVVPVVDFIKAESPELLSPQRRASRIRCRRE